MTTSIKPLVVMKFGGAALATPENILITCKIINSYSKKNRLVIVVSAIKGVTDKLYQIGKIIREEKLELALKKIENLHRKHLDFLEKIKNPLDKIRVQQEIKLLFDLLEIFIKKITPYRFTLSQMDFIVSFGERLSSRIISHYLKNESLAVLTIDTRDFFITTDEFGQAKPIILSSKKKIRNIIGQCLKNKTIPIVTGYIGRTRDGCITTFGRGGSDYSASLIANFIDADRLILWKDVNGLYNEDPKKNSQAQLLSQVTYDQAMKLSINGAKIIHPESIIPTKEANIPVSIKCFLKPNLLGTIIKNKINSINI